MADSSTVTAVGSFAEERDMGCALNVEFLSCTQLFLRPGLVQGTPPGPSATWNLKEALLLCPSSAAFPGVENLRPSSAT